MVKKVAGREGVAAADVAVDALRAGCLIAVRARLGVGSTPAVAAAVAGGAERGAFGAEEDVGGVACACVRLTELRTGVRGAERW